MTSTKHSISAAHRITGKSRTTIDKHIKSGKLSCEQDANGNKVIDASELLRFYGEDCDFERAESSAKKSSRKSNQDVKGEQGMHSELNTVQQLLDSERKERQREREQLQDQIDRLSGVLERSQDGHNRLTLLLEDRTGGVGEWENSLRNLEERIANQENQFRKKYAESKRQLEHTKLALQEEQNKSFLQKLLG